MKLIYYLLFHVGLIQHSLVGKTNKYSYLAFRKLHGLTNGKVNRKESEKINRKSQKHNFTELTHGITGELDSNGLSKIVEELNTHGYHVFDQKLSLEQCDQIIDTSLTIPANTIPKNECEPVLIFDSKNPKAPMYKFNEEDLLENESLRSILFDVNFLRIAQEYLNCLPLNDIFVMWWSSVFSNNPNSHAAQLYHFDMDHLKFIKFFIYLTDVDAKSGPHCYVRGSHKNKPLALSNDRRYEDVEIQAHYQDDDFIEITGQKGTIVAVDTSGFHKGKLPENRERLIVQIEYTNSFFGQKVANLKKAGITVSSNQFLEKFQDSFRRLF
ncbi:MAG: phytanoyl-CoA dioxygenase family protein [Cyclobacteriaceae bacterium]